MRKNLDVVHGAADGGKAGNRRQGGRLMIKSFQTIEQMSGADFWLVSGQPQVYSDHGARPVPWLPHVSG